MATVSLRPATLADVPLLEAWDEQLIAEEDGRPVGVVQVIDPLESNVAARRFYQRLGFVEVGPRRFGRDHCIVYRIDRRSWEHAAVQGPPT